MVKYSSITMQSSCVPQVIASTSVEAAKIMQEDYYFYERYYIHIHKYKKRDLVEDHRGIL